MIISLCYNRLLVIIKDKREMRNITDNDFDDDDDDVWFRSIQAYLNFYL